MDTDALKQAASQVARENRLPVALVLAVIEVESGGDVFSWNPEPRYHYLWNIKKNEPFRHLTHDEDFSEKPPWDFFSAAGDRDAEWWGQQASWGPMQVMGAVAREYGFNEHFPNLCGILGLHYGAMHLSMLRDRFFSRYGWEGWRRPITQVPCAGATRRKPDTSIRPTWTRSRGREVLRDDNRRLTRHDHCKAIRICGARARHGRGRATI